MTTGTLPLSRRVRRGVFAVYWAALFTATHWPALQIPEIVPRTDIVAHAVAFFLFTFLLWGAELIGPAARARSVAILFPAALVYAGLDEYSQSIPILKRWAVWDDFFANALGVGVGTAAAWGSRLLLRVRAGVPEENRGSVGAAPPVGGGGGS